MAGSSVITDVHWLSCLCQIHRTAASSCCNSCLHFWS